MNAFIDTKHVKVKLISSTAFPRRTWTGVLNCRTSFTSLRWSTASTNEVWETLALKGLGEGSKVERQLSDRRLRRLRVG